MKTLFKPEVFRYKIVEIKPIDELSSFMEHPRIRVFCEKGIKCLECNRKAELIAKGIDRVNIEHWDLYSKEKKAGGNSYKYVPLTVDPIIPRSLGGPDVMSNFQPLCVICNKKKGNGQNHRSYDSARRFKKVINLDKTIPLNVKIYKKINRNFHFVGNLVEFEDTKKVIVCENRQKQKFLHKEAAWVYIQPTGHIKRAELDW